MKKNLRNVFPAHLGGPPSDCTIKTKYDRKQEKKPDQLQYNSFFFISLYQIEWNRNLLKKYNRNKNKNTNLSSCLKNRKIFRNSIVLRQLDCRSLRHCRCVIRFTLRHSMCLTKYHWITEYFFSLFSYCFFIFFFSLKMKQLI